MDLRFEGVIGYSTADAEEAAHFFEHTLGLDEAIQHDLDPKLRELAYLTASKVNHCTYCAHYHHQLARKAGLNEAQTSDILRAADSGAYTEVERLVIRFAHQVRGHLDLR